MTIEVHVITSVALSDDDLNSVVGELRTALGIAPIPYWTSVWDGVFQLWLDRMTELETCYEEADISNFATMLGAPVAHYLEISIGSGERSYANMKRLVSLMRQRWPLVVDDGHDLYGPGEIAGYVSGDLL